MSNGQDVSYNKKLMIEKNYWEVFYNNKGTLYIKAITVMVFIYQIIYNVISISVHIIYNNNSTNIRKM